MTFGTCYYELQTALPFWHENLTEPKIFIYKIIYYVQMLGWLSEIIEAKHPSKSLTYDMCQSFPGLSSFAVI